MGQNFASAQKGISQHHETPTVRGAPLTQLVHMVMVLTTHAMKPQADWTLDAGRWTLDADSAFHITRV